MRTLLKLDIESLKLTYHINIDMVRIILFVDNIDMFQNGDF